MNAGKDQTQKDKADQREAPAHRPVHEPGRSDRPRVVIVGAGFAGLHAARELRNEPVDVLLIDRNNYHKFQPLLYQVATAGLDPDEVAHNIRSVFRRAENVEFLLGTVEGIDRERRLVHTKNGEEIAFDYLILAPGAVTTYFGIEGAEENSLPLKSLPDALSIRTHLLRQFERVARDGPEASPGALNFVIVGGGPTGVEMAGALIELRDVLQRDYKSVDTAFARVIIIEMLDELLPGQHPELGAYARRVLERRGVEVRTGTAVERVTENVVHIKDGESIPAETLIWAAGVQAHPLGEALGVEPAKGGRIPVGDDLSIEGSPEVFVAGDVAAAMDPDENLYPQLAAVAIQQGRHAARQVLRRVEARGAEPFRYRDFGYMSTIGRNAAVGEFPGGIRVKGFIAWVMWVVVHVGKLMGFRNRLSVILNYIYNYLTFDRNARLIFDVVPVPEEVPMEVDEVQEEVEEAVDEFREEEGEK
jgi:NADH:ubiquinone reductase (H+-translocating)